MPANTSTQFERTFADLAYTAVRDKAPALLQHLIGFQLIEKDDEDTHAVGVFGFQLGEDLLYAPMFFLNGELKGSELLYVKSRDAFVPLEESWVNYLLNRRPRTLGEVEPRKPDELGIRMPHFRQFSTPPSIQTSVKTSEWLPPDVVYKLSRISPCDERYKALDARFTVSGFLKHAGIPAARRLAEQFQKDHKFAEAVLRFYPVEELFDAKKYVKQAGKRVKRAGVRPARPIVLTRGDVRSGLVNYLTDAQKEAALRDGYIVLDERKPEQCPKLFHAKLAEAIVTPSGDGVYNVIMEDGNFQPMLISRRDAGFHQAMDCTSAYLFDLDEKRAYKAPLQGIPTRGDVAPADMQKLIDKLPAASSAAVGDYAVFISPVGQATDILEIKQKNTGLDKRTELRVGSSCWQAECLETSPVAEQADRNLHPELPDYRSNPHGSIQHVVLTNKEGVRATKVGDTLFLPNGFRVLKLKERENDYPGDSVKGESKPEKKRLRVARIDEVTLRLLKTAQDGKVTHLKVSSSEAGEVMIQVGQHRSLPLHKEAAVRELVVKHGLKEGDADLILKTAYDRPNQPTAWYIKHAYSQGVAGEGNYINPAVFPEPQIGVDPLTGVPSMPSLTEIQPLSYTGQANRYLYDPMYGTDRSREFAARASESGQKEVLDTAVISGLVKTLDIDTMVDRYVPDLLLALDRLGRILILFYWHNKKFKERYGQQDMLELEDNLRNVFKILGDLTLFLKQKTVDPEPASSEAKLDEILGDM